MLGKVTKHGENWLKNKNVTGKNQTTNTPPHPSAYRVEAVYFQLLYKGVSITSLAALYGATKTKVVYNLMEALFRMIKDFALW